MKCTRSAIIIVLSALLTAAAPAWSQAPRLLEDGANVPLFVTPPPHATNVRNVSVDNDMLLGLGVGATFEIDLHGETFTAIVSRRRNQLAGTTVTGSIIGLPSSKFTVTVVDDAVAGYFFFGGGYRTMRLRYGGPGGLHYLHGIDGAMLPTCAQAELAQDQRERPDGLDVLPLVPPADGGGGVAGGACGTDVTFDIMMIYSDDARAAAGGTAAIQAEAINAVELVSLCIGSCYLLIDTNIVYLAEVGYGESSSQETNLDRLTDPDDGILDGIHGIRNTVGADFVQMLLSNGTGLGHCFSSSAEAFSIARWDLAADNLTTPHEVGHNIGCAHNPENATVCTPTEIGYGHNFWVPAISANRRTVMAYSVLPGDERIPFYSNPDCEYEDVPTGTANRDNLSVIFARQYTCEGFRLTRMDVWVNFGWNGPELGTPSLPFDTIAEGVNRTLPNPVTDFPVLHLQAGSTSETLTISKPMTIEACGGTVVIGQ